jgi:predicted GTPase
MRKPTAKQAAKALEAKINRACCVACSNIPIDLMRGVPAVGKKCRELIDLGIDDAELALRLRAFVKSIAENV